MREGDHSILAGREKNLTRERLRREESFNVETL
jgi:hypothetical protein